MIVIFFFLVRDFVYENILLFSVYICVLWYFVYKLVIFWGVLCVYVEDSKIVKKILNFNLIIIYF